MTILMTLIDPRKKHRPSRKLKPKLQRMAKANAESQAYPFVAPPSYIQFLDFVYNSAFHSKRFSYVWTRPGPCELEHSIPPGGRRKGQLLAKGHGNDDSDKKK